MKVAGWLSRLDDAFGEGQFIGPDLLPVVTAETDYGVAAARSYAGFFALSSCIQSLVLQTLATAQRTRLAKSGEGWFRPVLLSFAGLFRILRAAESLFLHGYPLNAYAQLRDLKDRLLATGAVINGYITFQDANGWNTVNVAPELFTIEDFRKRREARKKADRFILDHMTGKQSGLSIETRSELRKWSDFFHTEVHGGRFTFALEGEDWLYGRAPLPIAPSLGSHSKGEGLFISHFEQLGWLLVRTLPYLQPPETHFSSKWHTRWAILDDSLRIVTEERVSAERPLFAAFLELVNQKFAFTPSKTCY